MDQENYAPPSFQASAEPRKTRWWLWGCGGALLLLMLALGSCVLLFNQGTAATEPRARQYLEDWSQERFQANYQAHAEAWKTKDDLETYLRFARTMHRVLGRIYSLDRTGVNLNRFNGRSTATYTFQARFANGEGTITLQLINEQDAWQVLGVNFNSPAISAALKCDACGFKNPGIAPLCGQCGAKLPAFSEYLTPRPSHPAASSIPNTH